MRGATPPPSGCYSSAVTISMDTRVWLLVTLLFYAVGALHALLYAVLRRSVLTTVSLTATLLGFACHTATLALRWKDTGHFPAVGSPHRTRRVATEVVAHRGSPRAATTSAPSR